MLPCNQTFRLFLAAMLLGGAVVFLFAQTSSALADFNPRFEIFNLPGGEAANNVQCIVQDSSGFLWLGSQGGLHRFDGQRVVTYHNEPADSTSIASDYVEWIFLDKNGRLWLGHWGHGLSIFDPATEKCIRFVHDPADPNSLSDNRVSMIAEDREGYIWIATSNGLNRFDPADRRAQFKRFLHDPADGRSLSYNIVRSLFVDKNGVLWVGCGVPWDEQDPQVKRGGLNRYDGDGKFTRFLHDPADPNSLSDNRVRAIFEDSRGHFWVGTAGNAALHRMDRATGTFTRMPFDPLHPDRLSSPTLRKSRSKLPGNFHISFIREDRDGRLWIGAMEGGLNVFDPGSNAMQHFEAAAGMTDSLQTKTVWAYCQTRDGVIWLGCGNGGWLVYRVKPDLRLFPFYDIRLPGTKNLEITGMLEDASGRLWLQTTGGFTGVLRFDRKTDKLERFRYEPRVEYREFLDFFELGNDPFGNIWASTEQGLYKISLQAAERGERRFVLDTTISKSIDYPHLWPPFFDRNGDIWIGSFGKGIYRFSKDWKQIAHYRHDPADPRSLGGDQVEKVFEDTEGHIWAQGGSIGVDADHPLFFDRFDPQDGSFDHFVPPGEMGDPMKVVEDRQGNFWINAYPYGIRKINPNGGQGAYKSFTVANSALPFNSLIEMRLDHEGHIWMLNDKGGIVELHPESEQFFSHTALHGVRSGAVSFLAGSWVSAEGEILFGGKDGFYAFFPEEVRRRATENPPFLRLTSFKINGKTVVPGSNGSPLSRPVWETGEIRLSHDRNVFSIGIACFDFNGAEHSRLEFMLVNYDRSWRSDLLKGEITYVNVPPGEYVLRARGANSLGAWSERSLRIVISPPWWRTWWAYVLYTALFLGGIFSLYRFQLSRRLEHAETLRLQELDSVKTKLYTNITHEFRTPLTVILGMARQVLDNPKEHFRYGLDMIIRNGQNLLELVNQMLDLNKLESGKLSLHLRQGDVVNFLKYLVESFHSLAKSKNIQIHFLNDVEALTMDFDEERLQQVVSNLLSNAVKFTPEGGHIYFSVGSSSQSLVIKVKDTGVGISEGHLPHIFDRFYQAYDTHTRHGEGTGIGLALAKELVKLMEGDITVKSTAGKGTEFAVTLPARVAGLSPVHEGELRWKGHEEALVQPLLAGNHEASAEKPLVLIAEDNADVVTYLASCLAADYRLAVAKDGHECEEMAFNIIPDLIVTDVMMPNKDGFEVCETLKNDERTSHIPVIMLTAKADTDSKLEGLECGADAYLMKPFHKEELLLRIKKLLELRQHLQQHYLLAAGLTEGAVVQMDMPVVSNIEHAFVTKARALVEAHLDDLDFDVEKFCRALTLSHPQVHRKLSALTGLAANKFIRSIRLNKAKSLLLNPEMTITAVAFDSGFSDPSYFGKVFKQEFGLTPLEWREQH